MKIPFVIGESVKVIDGPFNNFSGVIDEINEEEKTESNGKNIWT